MHFLLKKIGKWCLPALLFFVATSSRAQTSLTFKAVLDGSKNELLANKEVTVQDTAYIDPDRQSNLYTPYPVRNIITFRINEYSNMLLPVKFTATANVRITYDLPDHTSSFIDRPLVIDYDTSGIYTTRNSFVFNNTHKVTVKILDISTDAGNNVLNALLLENEMQAQPIYILSCTADAIEEIGPIKPAPANTDSTDEIGVTWTAKYGADAYDLEWAYIDSSALNRYGNPVNAQLLFENNATRVTVKENTYRIPLLYDNGGVLYYRVRAVQEKVGGQRVEANWSSNSSTGLGSFNFCGHQRNLNWQSTVSYAEEGKRKAVVKYFDGSLRSRQTVTKDNTTDTTLVAETFYDYQGRPVISVMPVPTLNSAIKYSRNFNQKLDGSEYDKDSYDHINNESEFLTASAQPMSDGSGANQYYSANNPNKENGFNKFIPDAKGYAFTEISYTQDNTGRISRQGGVGPTYKLGSNHETKYFYNTAAQKELDALFGTEVGNENHYFKNMVRDANGQYAVTYQDMHGRTIATALAGDPDSANLAPLPSDVPFIVTDVLSGPGKNTVNGMVMETHKSQAVAVQGDYEFNYTLVPPVLQKEGCSGPPVCYNGLYELEITITDDSYNQLLGGQPIVHKIPVPAFVTSDCAIAPDPITLSFTQNLPKGSYEITKRLTISRKGLEFYRDNVFMVQNHCKTLEDFVQEQRTLLLNNDCTPTCQSCLDSLGTWDQFRTNYMRRAGILTDTASYRGEALAAYQSAQEACDLLCNNTSEEDDIKNAMLLDVTAPSGQYADPADAGNVWSIFFQPNANTPPTYKRTDIVYLDENGKPDSVYDQYSNTFIIPQNLRPEQFAAAFKDSWAPLLLQFHPEYCKLLEYEKYAASNLWDRKFGAVDTYLEAKQKGFLNPTGGTGDPFSTFPPAQEPDPLVNQGLKNQLEDNMVNYKHYQDKTHNVTYSLWTAATSTVKCPENSEGCVNGYLSPADAFSETKMCAGDLDMAWRSFRELYLQLKRGIISERVRNAACPSGQRGPSPDDITHAGKQPNFNDATAVLNQNVSYLNGGNLTAEQAKNNGQNQLNQVYDDNCKAYATVWMQQLSGCRFYSQSDLDAIIPLLTAVCKEGADQNHVNGASTVRPESTSSDRSFQQVLDNYNSQHGIAKSVDCNGELITTPKPYDRQPAYGSKTNYTKPEECECEKLNALHNEFLALKTINDSNFSAYIQRTRGVHILESNLEKLLNACNATSGSCTYLAEPLQIPGLMQCYTATACATCKVVDSLYQKYITTYPNDTPHQVEPDSVQRKKNELFANFMNNRLGFSKSAWEYLAFRDSCGKVVTQDTVVCQSTRQLIKTYSSGGGDMLFDIQRTADNGYLLAGYTTTGVFSKTLSTNASGGNNKDAYIIKTDSKGAFQWAKTYGGTDDDEFGKLKPTSDGGYIALGTTKSFTHPAGDIFVVKMDANGNVIWSRAIGFGTGNGERGNDIVQLNNGGFAFAGGYNYEAGSADWAIGTLSADGNLGWVKQMGSASSDPLISLLADNDTLVVSASINQGTYYDGVLLKLNKNTGVRYGAGTQYDINSKSNWFAGIFKTPAGYKIPVLNTKDYNSGDGQALILDLRSSGEIISSKAFTPPAGNVTWLPMAFTSDGGVIASQPWANSPQDVYLHKLGANNTLTWSSRAMIDGDEVLQQILQNPDGTYAGVGAHNNQAMLMLTSALGKTGCQDSAITTAYTNIEAHIIGAFTPQHETLLPNPSINITVVPQDWFPTEGGIACSGVDTCFKVSNGPLLCGNAAEIFPTVPLDTINNCSDNDFFAISNGTILYKAYRDSIKNSFEQDYINTCLKATELENFTVTYGTREYHYTLYYYDQAGNLVKTIPPAGVVVNRTDEWLNNVKTARAAGEQLTPAHTLPTTYRYNSLNQVIAQKSPDGGINHFWYDRLGRLVISQNEKQALTHAYSYTLYDDLGRITEVGQISSSAAMTDAISRKADALAGWINAAANNKEQITRTVYDIPHTPLEGLMWDATNLRNRVSWTGVYNTAANLADPTTRSSATFYSYDILGNVKELLQDFNSGQANNVANRFKRIKYDYDLVSGKVNMVRYQPGEKDAFYHRYTFDAQNRITNAETSADSVYWENDAFYQYYKDGPLARTIIGQQQVQGMDYAYTLQGWLKGVNSTTLTPEYDMGNDGSNGGITARDAFGFSLNYFGERDYRAVNANMHPFVDGKSGGAAFKPLFNGNVASISLNLPKAGEPLLYSYSYDVLNRLVGMNAARNLNTTTNNWEPIAVQDFAETVSYDANGNILSYNRNGNNTWAGKPMVMDQLTYNYIPNTNKLDAISEPSANDGNYDNDIDGQSEHNYEYDKIGNLTKDEAAGIGADGIQWTVYGKIKSITKTNPDNTITTINYTYDPTGKRISKNVNGVETRYIRDATGNVMSVYVAGDPAINSGALSQTEVDLYGSSRLGLSTRITNVQDISQDEPIPLPGLGSGTNVNFVRGSKFFELTNHLGNVLATVTDAKNAVPGNGSIIDYYEPHLASVQDYYPFGMLEPGRSWNMGNYRYGFNGMENDNEVKGLGNQLDYGMRIYDPRIGRFLSVDPLTPRYPFYTPYLYAANSPIRFIDRDGEGPGDGIKFYVIFFTQAMQMSTKRMVNDFASSNAGKATGKTAAQVYVSTLGVINGTTKLLSFGLYSTPYERLNLPEEYRSWYYWGTVAGASQPMPESFVGSGGSPSFSLSRGRGVIAPPALNLNIKLSTILFANSGPSDNNSQSGNDNQASNTESNTPQQPVEFEPVQVKGGKGGAAINAEIKKLLRGERGNPRLKVDGSGDIQTIENRKGKPWEIKWLGAFEYQVDVDGVSNKFRILKKPLPDGTFKWGWTAEHYELGEEPKIYEFKLKGSSKK